MTALPLLLALFSAAHAQSPQEACQKRRAMDPGKPDPMCDILEKGGTPTPDQLKTLMGSSEMQGMAGGQLPAMPGGKPGEDFKAMSQATGGQAPPQPPAGPQDPGQAPLPAGAEAPGQAPAAQPQAGYSGGGGSQGGSIASPIQSLGGKFKGFSGADAMRQRMQRPAPAPAPAPAPKPAEKPAPPKPAEKAPEPPKPKPAEKAPAPAPAAPAPPAPPATENPLLYSYEPAPPLLRDLDADEPRAELRPISNIPLPRIQANVRLQGELRADIPPVFKFALVPIEHDPFNLGLPRLGAGAEKPGWLSRLKALIGRAPPPGPYLRYASFLVPDDPAAAEMTAAGLPLMVFWSGRAPQSTLAQSRGEPAAPPASAAPPLDGPAAEAAARDWGLR